MLLRLFNRYWSTPALLSLVAEAGIQFLAVFLAYQVRFLRSADAVIQDDGFWFRALVVAAVVIVCLYLNGLYDFGQYLNRRQQGVRILRAYTFATLGLWAVYYVFPVLFLGRGVLALTLAFSILLLSGWRVLLEFVLRRQVFFDEKILIVGAGERGQRIAQETLALEHLGYRIVGFVDDNHEIQGTSVVNPTVIGMTSQACNLAQHHDVTRVIVSQGDQRGKLDLDALLACKTSGIPVESGADYFERLTGKVDLDGLRIKSWLVFSKGYVVSTGVQFWKRGLDLAISGFGLVLAAPIMAVLSLAIKLDSRGPLLFRQERVGRDGVPFMLLKFRSMRSDAETASGPVWAKRQDSRITRVGRWMRQCRLDELPQLWNVLRGDMSMVGPRPERDVFVKQLEELAPLYRQRLVVRPGLTGWAQINAAYAATMEDSVEKLRYDLYYVKNLSVFLDFSILASTIRTVLLGRGAQ